MKHRLPFVTLALVATTIAVHLVPGWADGLQFDRAALAGGEWWRWFTGHLTHFEANHLLWDGSVLCILGIAAERQSRARFVTALLLAAVVVSAVVWLWQPQFAIYRGLSGLDSALFALLAGSLMRHAHRTPRLVGVAALIGLAAKCSLEAATGSTVFASGETYLPVPLAHLAGLAAGLITAAMPRAIPRVMPQHGVVHLGGWAKKI
jgi:rhomboid family GlyGly-CTERM serine protease